MGPNPQHRRRLADHLLARIAECGERRIVDVQAHAGLQIRDADRIRARTKRLAEALFARAQLLFGPLDVRLIDVEPDRRRHIAAVRTDEDRPEQQIQQSAVFAPPPQLDRPVHGSLQALLP